MKVFAYKGATSDPEPHVLDDGTEKGIALVHTDSGVGKAGVHILFQLGATDAETQLNFQDAVDEWFSLNPHIAAPKN